MSSLFKSAISHLNRMLGLESVSSFPSGHIFVRTNWDPSYFDIPYGTKPDEIERRICIAIGNTPGIFSRINYPTPRMQLTLVEIVVERSKDNDHAAEELVGLLINAYSSPFVQEVIAGLRAEIEGSKFDVGVTRAHRVLSFLLNAHVGLEF